MTNKTMSSLIKLGEKVDKLIEESKALRFMSNKIINERRKENEQSNNRKH